MMNNSIEFKSIKDLINQSNTESETERGFEYNLNDKNTRLKLIKSSKRVHLEVEEKSCSVNLIFCLGAWMKVVLPCIQYMKEFKRDNTCKAGSSTVKITSFKTGTEASGLHVDTQISFLINNNKAVCHFYNTTQLVMVNGTGYRALVDEFLVPFFNSKIETCSEEIRDVNKTALDSLSANKVNGKKNTGKGVKRGIIKYKGGSSFYCKKCDFVSNTITALAKHSRNEHTVHSVSSLEVDLVEHSSKRSST